MFYKQTFPSLFLRVQLRSLVLMSNNTTLRKLKKFSHATPFNRETNTVDKWENCLQNWVFMKLAHFLLKLGNILYPVAFKN